MAQLIGLRGSAYVVGVQTLCSEHAVMCHTQTLPRAEHALLRQLQVGCIAL